MSTIFVSPAEPAVFKSLGHVSSLPERLGCDFTWTGAHGRVGVQRKEVKDLRASVDDGRLGKELGQMELAQITTRVLVVEGVCRWDSEGRLMDRWGGRWTRAMWNGVLWGVQNAGWWVHVTANTRETVDAIQLLELWTRKERHGSLAGRGGVPSIWGSKPSDREYAVWVLQGIEGVGAELAGRIYDRWGGLPITWAEGVDEKWLMGVEGIGKVKAKKILRGLERRARDEATDAGR